MDIYVGNIHSQATEKELRSLFEEHGRVSSVALREDRRAGNPRGFAFVSMPDLAEAEAAIEALDGLEWMGRELRISKAFPRRPPPSSE